MVELGNPKQRMKSIELAHAAAREREEAVRHSLRRPDLPGIQASTQDAELCSDKAVQGSEASLLRASFQRYETASMLEAVAAIIQDPSRKRKLLGFVITFAIRNSAVLSVVVSAVSTIGPELFMILSNMLLGTTTTTT